MSDAASKLFNQHMGKLEDEHNKLLDVKKKKIHYGYNVEDLFIKDFNNEDWFVLPLFGDEKVALMLPPEGDKEEVKEGNGLKVLTPDELLTRFPVL